MKLNLLNKNTADHSELIFRAVVVVAIFAAFVVAGLLRWKLSDLLPTVFATNLFAIAWRGAAEPLAAIGAAYIAADPKAHILGVVAFTPPQGGGAPI